MYIPQFTVEKLQKKISFMRKIGEAMDSNSDDDEDETITCNTAH